MQNVAGAVLDKKKYYGKREYVMNGESRLIVCSLDFAGTR